MRDTMHSAYLLSKDGWLQDGMLSHAGIVSKRLKISSNFFSLGRVALQLLFCNTALWLRNSKGRGAFHLLKTFLFTQMTHAAH